MNNLRNWEHFCVEHFFEIFKYISKNLIRDIEMRSDEVKIIVITFLSWSYRRLKQCMQWLSLQVHRKAWKYQQNLRPDGIREPAEHFNNMANAYVAWANLTYFWFSKVAVLRWPFLCYCGITNLDK